MGHVFKLIFATACFIAVLVFTGISGASIGAAIGVWVAIMWTPGNQERHNW